MDTALLLKAFTPAQPWVERGCGYRQWREAKGEVGGKDDGGFASAQSVDPSSYAMEGMLGEGNYSQVIQAMLRSTQQVVALKIIDKQKVKRYKKEDEVLVEKWVLTRLRHPTIARLYHAFQDVSALYISMELVPGGELWAITHRVGLPMSISTFYAAQMLEVLQFMHERDVVHRDVKPENVLISENGHIKLIDFGTAKLLRHPIALGADTEDDEAAKRDRRTRHKEFIGTPEYMAPEAINNKFTDQRSDLWSFGWCGRATRARAPALRPRAQAPTAAAVASRAVPHATPRAAAS
jgi:3-phosphoinositide dependent protein kinase-1